MTSGRFAPANKSRTQYTMTFGDEQQPAALVRLQTRRIHALRSVTPEELAMLHGAMESALEDRLRPVVG
jgi:hypothetical protein